MKKREQWTSKIGFILAAAGSAIGLGAIWKLPYVAGTNGGGAFFLIFLLFTLLIAMPLLLAEFILGRSTQKEAVSAYRQVSPGTKWHWIGRLGVITSFLLLSFYSVVGGWILIYLFRSITGGLASLEADQYGPLFNNVIANPVEALIAHFIFMILTIWVVQGGIQKGIERASKYMMPALFILFLIIVIRSLSLDGAWEGVTFFLQPDLSEITSETILFAMGQSFFSLSLGVSIMVTYSSYLPKEESLPRSVGSVVGLSLFISLLAGLAIFPAVFAFGFEPSEGPGLIFAVLPAVFSQMAFGSVFFTLFIALLLFATLTSAFSLLEIIVASITKNDQEKRKKAAWSAGLLIFVMGIPSALSFGVMNDFLIFGLPFFDAVDFLVSNILLPIGALLISIFVPLKIPKDVLWKEMSQGTNIAKKWFAIWLFLIRYLAPVAIAIVFLNVIGVI
ncbi:sodium-dependent transporter [Desertibacillus haloalkaliphilus]|uniref:sodium-dependent transporter n=1 Tax=Desertibacillus haloalkaliphilus TaxID=1328930 RepID=UPI001C255AE0|nr:sodium-dependent transporter [Desertibacillus haloalkaliphilus]MBU8905356.1 sodium-dependent transporter [Desertibacillus haloalkaliphilus]